MKTKYFKTVEAITETANAAFQTGTVKGFTRVLTRAGVKVTLAFEKNGTVVVTDISLRAWLEAIHAAKGSKAKGTVDTDEDSASGTPMIDLKPKAEIKDDEPSDPSFNSGLTR